VLKTADTLKKFNRSTVYSYFRKHYAPGEIILSVAGDVDHFKVRDSLNKTLKPEYLRVKERRKHNMQRPRVRRGTQVIRRNLEQAHVLIGFPSVAYNHGDRFVAYLMSNYLGGGMSSTLFQEIREKRGLAYTIYSTNSAFSDSGVFSTYVATNSEGVKTCLDITAKQIEKLKNEKLDSKALDIIKQNLKSTILLNLDSVENRMTAIAKAEMFFGKQFEIDDVFRLIDQVTPQRIQALAKKIMRPDQTLLTLLGPFSKSQANNLYKNFVRNI